MTEDVRRLAGRVRSELLDMDKVEKRITEGWRRAQRSADDYYLDGVALNLHGIYNGLERLFELIATAVDERMPQGENWHRALLEQMSADMPPVRPAVISEHVRNRLDEYRGFRHVVRNVYTYNFDPARIERLVDGLPALLPMVRAELLSFSDFLEERASAGDMP